MRLGGLITIALAGMMAAPAHAADHSVAVGNGNRFQPNVLHITEGDVVNWNWVGPDTNHTTTREAEDQTTWDSEKDNPNPEVGFRFSREFQDVGEFEYHCKVHGAAMSGKIIVAMRQNNPNPPPVDTKGPEFGTPKVKPRRRRVSFRLDEDAKIVARLRGPTRRTLKMNARMGSNTLRLPKRLRRGRYALVMRATDAAGNESIAARVKFRIR